MERSIEQTTAKSPRWVGLTRAGVPDSLIVRYG